MSEEVEIRFEDVAYGGDGVARLPDGMAVFAPFAAVGDVARVRLIERRPRFLRGEIVEILAPGSGREAPVCPYYGACGGCRYQHVTAAEEARIKKAQLEQLLTRVAGLKGAPAVEAPGAGLRGEMSCVGSGPPLPRSVPGTSCDPAVAGLPQQVPGGVRGERGATGCYGYRNKLTLSPILDRGRLAGWGFTTMDNRTVTPISRCALGHEDLNRTLEGLSRSGASPKAPARAADAPLVLRRSAKGEVLAFRDAPAMWLRERALSAEVVVPAGGFYQVNPPVLDLILLWLREALGRAAIGTLVDGYCGCGVFSVGLGSMAGHVTGIETGEESIECAKENARTAGLAGAEFWAAPVERKLDDVLRRAQAPVTLLLDPPRGGLDERVAKTILARRPERLALVSCNAGTLCRDLTRLGGVYVMERIALFDMFPRTAHFETVAVMNRAGVQDGGRR